MPRPNLAAPAWADTEQPAITRIAPPPGEPAGTDLDRAPGALQPSTAEVGGAAQASDLTHPDEVNQAILGFLTGLDGG